MNLNLTRKDIRVTKVQKTIQRNMLMGLKFLYEFQLMKMIKELMTNKESGLLGISNYCVPPVMVQYWRSLEQLFA